MDEVSGAFWQIGFWNVISVADEEKFNNKKHWHITAMFEKLEEAKEYLQKKRKDSKSMIESYNWGILRPTEYKIK